MTHRFGSPAIIAFIVLDFAVWLEHVASHKFHILWRIHRMHHSDLGFDLTTALRFHPLEIVLSMLWKALIILCLGPPAIAVLVFRDRAERHRNVQSLERPICQKASTGGCGWCW